MHLNLGVDDSLFKLGHYRQVYDSLFHRYDVASLK